MPKLVVLQETNIDKICRTCLSSDASISIYEYCASGVCIIEKLYSSTLVQFAENEGLPSNICKKCLDHINDAYLFSKKCEETDRILRKYFNIPLLKEINDKKRKKVDKKNYEPSKVENNFTNEDLKLIVLSSSSEDETADILINNKTDSKENEFNDNLSTNIDEASKSILITENQPHVPSNIKIDIPDEKIKKSRKCPPYECKKCSVSFPVFHQLKEHYRKPQHKNRTHVSCKICNKLIKCLYYYKHLRQHQEKNSCCCDICGKQFNDDSNLARHKKIHLGIKPYLCDICGNGFTQSTTLKNHRRIHTGENPYICPICGNGFRSSPILNQHIKQHEYNETEDRILKVPANKRNPGPRNMPIEEWLNKEIVTRRFNAMKPENEAVDCNICKQSFRTPAGLKTHLVSHQEKKFHCNECSWKFSSSEKLETHKKCHSSNRPFSCHICGKTFTTQANLKNHIFIHTGQKPFSCKNCDKNFVHLGQLKSHMKVHTGDRPYVCKFCGKAFALNGNLTVHLRKHTGETPFVCNVCNKGYPDSSSLKKHQKGHGALELSTLLS